MKRRNFLKMLSATAAAAVVMPPVELLAQPWPAPAIGVVTADYGMTITFVDRFIKEKLVEMGRDTSFMIFRDKQIMEHLTGSSSKIKFVRVPRIELGQA